MIKPMAAAPMQYDDKGRPAWDQMWTTYCAMAVEGGPKHRPESERVVFEKNATKSKRYTFNAAEIKRGLELLGAKHVIIQPNGEMWIDLQFANKARWYAFVIKNENVETRTNGKYLIFPCSDKFEIEKEVKSILTVWGKCHHYWLDHRNRETRSVIILFGYDPILQAKI